MKNTENRTQKFLDEMKTEHCRFCGGSMDAHDDAVCERDHGGSDAGGGEIETLESEVNTLNSQAIRQNVIIADLESTIRIMKGSEIELARVAENLYQAGQGILIDPRIPTSRKSEIETAVRGYEFKS